MVTDPISDLIIRLKNASFVGKPSVTIIQSKFSENVAHALKKAGFLSSVVKDKEKKEIVLGLVYFGSEPRIHGVDRVSKSSRRVYQKARDIRSYRSGFGNVFLSTPKGILTGDEAKKLGVGGEVLFKIW
ncbi:MAG: 30S ribosomal protein S8 [Candidatus Taylorbacteria bacterium]|nr:30S ribosomal protein S8 [Candidatus Taylorbacteria bacterium]